MTEERRKSDRRVPPSVAQHAIEERAQLLARIAELEVDLDRIAAHRDAVCRTIERLVAKESNDGKGGEREAFEASGIKSASSVWHEGCYQYKTVDDEGEEYFTTGLGLDNIKWQAWQARAAITAQQGASVAVPEGYALVPVEPTDEMRDAGNVWTLNRSTLMRVWDAMIAAAPSPASLNPVAWVVETIDPDTRRPERAVDWYSKDMDPLPIGTKLYTVQPPAPSPVSGLVEALERFVSVADEIREQSGPPAFMQLIRLVAASEKAKAPLAAYKATGGDV